MIEAIPNISEGRRQNVLQELEDSLTRADDVHLLNSSADPSHNRSVFTIAANANALSAALIDLFSIAIRHIDLRVHRGEHPRIGAIDVVPIVPLFETNMSACVDLAAVISRMIADRFKVPIFWYEYSATVSKRKKLENIRRGQFEGLADKLKAVEWKPDCGPTQPHPSAGACVIGARHPLVAFNVNLATENVFIAKRIARRIRERDGGLPSIKALGIKLTDRGLVQVSTNITDYKKTSIPKLLQTVEREAKKLGVRIAGTELIGLAPANAVMSPTTSEPYLEDLNQEQILEEQLSRHGYVSMP